MVNYRMTKTEFRELEVKAKRAGFVRLGLHPKATSWTRRKMKRQQKGYIFRSGKSWFVRYCDDVLQPDKTIKRKLVCKKLDVKYSDQYRTKASVKRSRKTSLHRSTPVS